MQKRYKRRCKCCGEPFETNRSDKYYLNRSHQVRHNNQNQSERRKIHGKMTKGLLETYKIYNDLLKDMSEIKKSKEFLRGRGANLALFTNLDSLEGKPVPMIFDIAIIDLGKYIFLKRIKND